MKTLVVKDQVKIIWNYIFVIVGSIIAITLIMITYIGATVIYPDLQSFFTLRGSEFSEFMIALAYPVFDSILLIPVISILWTLRRVDPLHAHWILLCSFVILSTIGDIGFAYTELLDPIHSDNTIWIWDTFFNSSYVCLAACLFWYYRFYVPTITNGGDSCCETRPL